MSRSTKLELVRIRQLLSESLGREEKFKHRNTSLQYTLHETKEALEELVRQKNNLWTEVKTINKTELTSILKQHYKYKDVEIEKVLVGTPNTSQYVYHSSSTLPLLLDIDIRYRRTEEEE